MIGEVERLLDQRIDIYALPLAAAAARMRQHAGDDAVGAPAVFRDLLEIAGQHSDDLVDLGALVFVERRHRRFHRLLQFVEQVDREAGEVVDEVERVFDFVGDAGGQLTERRHLLGVQEARLRRLQLLQCALGGVARRADLLLRALAFGDVAVDRHETAARYGIAAYLDNAPVGPRALEAQLLISLSKAAAEFRRDALGAEFAALGEEVDVVGIARPLRQQRVGQIEDPLEIQVPRRKVLLAVEHRHTVAHIVERDAQLGLALADLLQQPSIVHRDDRLRGEILQQRDLFIGKLPDLAATGADKAEQRLFLAQRDVKNATHAGACDEVVCPRHVDLR